MKSHYDVVIIGSGVSGAITASVLAKAGLSVLILEAGDDFHDRQEYVNRFYQADRSQRGSLSTIYPESPAACFASFANRYDYIIQNGPGHERFQAEYLRILGGTTLYWLGTALRMHHNDFKIHTLYGIGKDWPLTYSELEPWYCEAEHELGVAGESDEFPELHRSKPYPMPALPMSYFGNMIKQRVENDTFDGKKILVSHTPQARNSLSGYQDRPACAGHHSCIPICPIQAKYDALVHIKKAKQYQAEVQTQSVVYQLAADQSGRITHANYMRWDGSKQSVRAKIFVLAAHAIETPKLMLNSANNVLVNGIGNQSDQVGRNLMDHPSQLSYALAHEPTYPLRSPYSTSGIESLMDGPFRQSRAAFRVQISDTGWAWPTNSPFSVSDELIAAGYFGEELNQRIQHHVTRQISLNSLIEMLPNPSNRITLADETDILGIPKPFIKFKLDDYARRGLARSRDLHSYVFKKIGVSEEHHYPDQKWQSSGHIMGTTTMGDNAATSVVNKNLRCHDHDNLFIVGSSVFPSSFSVNPTLTIAALALKTADHIKQIFKNKRTVG